MALNQRLDIRQSQSLVMTPQLQQAIKLLQMSNLELQDFVHTELESNPLLERAEHEGDSPSETVATAPESTEQTPQDNNLTGTSDTPEPDIFAKDAPLDTDFDNVWAHEHGSGKGSASGFDDSDFSFEDNHSSAISLRDHLLAQVHCDLLEPAERMVGAALIDMLDDNGYLPSELDLVRAQLGAPADLFEQVISQIQQFDPPGIFARNLAECLRLQLRERNRLDPAMDIMLHHLELVASRDVKKLQQLCGVDAEDIADMLGELRRLNPRPAQAFTVDVTQTLIPDVLLRPLAGGGWQVELNAENLPRVLANESYYTRISAATKQKTERDYIQDRWQQANWLVKALHQRATTILKVATEIVRQQDKFFIYGVAQLRPLTLKQIAEAVEMHESTISRVTTNKHIATPRGIFELKYFFTNALSSNEGGESFAATAVRHKIKALIDAEASNAVLADDRIAALLQQDGINIARRTVAKYREAMQIPSSAARRRGQDYDPKH
jgi:RNA polymerase sigma-54 factor